MEKASIQIQARKISTKFSEKGMR